MIYMWQPEYSKRILERCKEELGLELKPPEFFHDEILWEIPKERGEEIQKIISEETDKLFDKIAEVQAKVHLPLSTELIKPTASWDVEGTSDPKKKG